MSGRVTKNSYILKKEKIRVSEIRTTKQTDLWERSRKLTDREKVRSLQSSLQTGIFFRKQREGINQIMERIKEYSDSVKHIERINKQKWDGRVDLTLDRCLSNRTNDETRVPSEVIYVSCTIPKFCINNLYTFFNNEDSVLKRKNNP